METIRDTMIWDLLVILQTPQSLYNIHVVPIFSHLTSLIQLTVEPQSPQSMASYSLTPTPQKVQWWSFIATQALYQKERWPQCVGVMVNGTPTQEVWTALPQVYNTNPRQWHGWIPHLS